MGPVTDEASKDAKLSCLTSFDFIFDPFKRAKVYNMAVHFNSDIDAYNSTKCYAVRNYEEVVVIEEEVISTVYILYGCVIGGFCFFVAVVALSCYSKKRIEDEVIELKQEN